MCDSVRLFIMSDEKDVQWSNEGMEGSLNLYKNYGLR